MSNGQTDAAAERTAHVARGAPDVLSAYAGAGPVVEVSPGVWTLRAIAERDAEIARLRQVIDDAWRLLAIARSGCDRLVRDEGSNVRLPHEVRMFALAFSPEGREGPAPLQVTGGGDVYQWFNRAREALR